MKWNLLEVDGTKEELAASMGFRGFIEKRGKELGLCGSVRRVDRNNARIECEGPTQDVSQFEDWLTVLMEQGWWRSMKESERLEREGSLRPRLRGDVGFRTMKSVSRRAVNGKYSNEKHDNSQSSSMGSDSFVRRQ